MRRRLRISPASSRTRPEFSPPKGPIATQPALPRGLLSAGLLGGLVHRAHVRRLAKMHRTCAYLAIEHRGLRQRDFLLAHNPVPLQILIFSSFLCRSRMRITHEELPESAHFGAEERR